MPLDAAISMIIVIAGALLAVSSANILHAVFGLVISLVGVAGIFLMLGSAFVAVMEVLIYVGGISVTMIFAVMMSSVTTRREYPRLGRRVAAALVSIAFFVGMAVVIVNSGLSTEAPTSTGSWNLEIVGMQLLDQYNLAFETLSLVLLLAIVGAIVISRRAPAPLPPDPEAKS